MLLALSRTGWAAHPAHLPALLNFEAPLMSGTLNSSPLPDWALAPFLLIRFLRQAGQVFLRVFCQPVCHHAAARRQFKLVTVESNAIHALGQESVAPYPHNCFVGGPPEL